MKLSIFKNKRISRDFYKIVQIVSCMATEQYQMKKIKISPFVTRKITPISSYVT